MPSINDLMEMVDALETKSVITAPTRCVAVRNRHSSCQHCIEMCPTNAISVDKNELEIDAKACVGCGACIAVCPTQALISVDPLEETLVQEITAATLNAEGIPVIACARIVSHQDGDPTKFAQVPCLARLTEELLVELASHGVPEVVLVDGTCKTCKYRVVNPAIEDTLDSARTLLEAVGCTTPLTRTSEFPAYAQLADKRAAAGAARREFFTSTGHYAKDVAKNAAEKMVSDKLKQLKLQKEEQSLREKIGVRSGSGKMPTIDAARNLSILDGLSRLGEPTEDEMFTRIFGNVVVDAEECSGCGMCVMFCPTNALQKSPDKHPNELREYLDFRVADCTQCQLCADACLKKCLEVEPVVSVHDLFDFEPRLVEISSKKKTNSLFRRK